MFSGLKNGCGPVSHGEYVSVASDATAGSAALPTGLSNIEACIVQITRGGKVTTSDAAVSYSGGTLTVANGTTYAVTAADVIKWVAIGT